MNYGVVPIFNLLDLNISNAYDRVNWTFMFEVMKKFGVPHTFINMIRLLFQNSIVNIKDEMTEHFELHWGAHQGCPLAP